MLSVLVESTLGGRLTAPSDGVQKTRTTKPVIEECEDDAAEDKEARASPLYILMDVLPIPIRSRQS